MAEDVAEDPGEDGGDVEQRITEDGMVAWLQYDRELEPPLRGNATIMHVFLAGYYRGVNCTLKNKELLREFGDG